MRSIMKNVLVVLFVLELVSLHLQADARRFKVEMKREKIDYLQPTSNAQPGRKLDDAVNGSFQTAATTNDTSNTAESNTNSSYGSYGNPSGSSTETHHAYTNECQPKKNC
ncbi:WD repeat-containing protein [Melia azedarach]|uniref:WD repeat-containing protein n=1 Tax=Melia azedarach TaxID=155640 RepID=A0ACC1Y835_MELAZ|nr:WD repeat-containing protein [Melia azedarach]